MKQHGDIVERLRRRASGLSKYAEEMSREEHDYCASGCPCDVAGDIFNEADECNAAADEIERLRHKIDELERQNYNLLAANAAAKER